MKKKIFLLGVFVIVAISGFFFYQEKSERFISQLVLDNIEALSQDESGSNGCSAKAYCYFGNKLEGEISCTGKKTCTSGTEYVICDGTRHSCA